VKELLAKIMPYKGIGLYVGDDEVVVSKVAGTPMGIVELDRHAQKYEPENLATVIGELLERVNGPKRNSSPVALGIPTKRVFYSTRAQAAGKSPATAQNVLREVMQSPNACIDELSVQVVKGSYAKRSLASVASCRHDYLVELLECLQQSNVQPFRTEPAPSALLRAASEKRRLRKNKPAVRLFLNQSEALAVVIAGTVCVSWKSIKLVPGSEMTAIGAAIRSSQTLLNRFGIEVPLDVVIAHGREDLREGLTSEAFIEKVGMPVVWCAEPELCGGEIAFGLALGCLGDQSSEVIDLSKSMTPKPSIWQIFPWGDLSVQIAIVLCMALFLFGHSRHARNAVIPVHAELAKRTWARNKSQADLVKEQRELTAKVDAIKSFVGSRILWSEYTHDVSERLPLDAKLSMFQGMAELEGGKGKPKKMFLMRGETPVDDDGAMPIDIDDFLSSLRSDPLLKRDFPEVEVTDIKTTQPTQKTDTATAIFTVLCLPKTVAVVAAPAKAQKGGH
jgi:hypothetical protein